MNTFFVRCGRLLLPLMLLVLAWSPGWAQSKLDTTKVSNFVATGDSIQDVMTLLGQDLNLRIVVSPSVKGNVNANLTGEVTLRAILDTILPPLQANYVEDGGIIRIMTQQEYDNVYEKAEQMVTRTFVLKNRKVEDLKPILEKYKSPDGRVTLNVEDNTVTVTDTAEALAKIEDQISIVCEGPEAPRSRVFKIENANLDELVGNLKKTLSRETEILVDHRLHLIIIRGSQDMLDKAEELVRICDQDLPKSRASSPRRGRVEDFRPISHAAGR